MTPSLLCAFFLLSLAPAALTLRVNGVLTLRATASKTGCAANSWQKRLDNAVNNVDTQPQARVRNLQRALQDPRLATDLQKAFRVIQEKGFGKGHPEAIDFLFPTGTIARQDVEGLAALTTQVPELFRSLQAQVPATILSPPDLEVDLVSELIGLATDPRKQTELMEEAKNAFRATPKGLETPRYKVLRKIDGPIKLGKPELIEIRAYEPFTKATFEIDTGDGKGSVFASNTAVSGFNSLTSYLFGRNTDNLSMAMTVPVIFTSGAGDKSSIAIALPCNVSDAPPAPLQGLRVVIERVPPGLVAVKPFAGIVTEEEVERQRLVLLAALSTNDTRVTNQEQVSVLQYNAPYTIPWRRRNEIAMVLESADRRYGADGEFEVVRVWEDEDTQQREEEKKGGLEETTSEVWKGGLDETTSEEMVRVWEDEGTQQREEENKGGLEETTSEVSANSSDTYEE